MARKGRRVKVVKIKFDENDAALREVVRYELTQVTGALDFRITHLLKALKDRALLMDHWDSKVKRVK